MGRFRGARTIFFVVPFLLLSLESSPQTQDAPSRFATKTHLLQGEYSFILHGTHLGSPYAVSGVLTLDGSGKITDGTATFGGTPNTFNLMTDQPNTYIVLSDGRGSLRVFFPTQYAFGLSCALAITESGRRIYLNATGLRSAINFEDIPGPLATGEAAAQQ